MTDLFPIKMVFSTRRGRFSSESQHLVPSLNDPNAYCADIYISPRESISFLLSKDEGAWIVEVKHNGAHGFNNKVYLPLTFMRHVVKADGDSEIKQNLDTDTNRLVIKFTAANLILEEDVTDIFGVINHWGRVTIPNRFIPQLKEILSECISKQ